MSPQVNSKPPLSPVVCLGIAAVPGVLLAVLPEVAGKAIAARDALWAAGGLLVALILSWKGPSFPHFPVPRVLLYLAAALPTLLASLHLPTTVTNDEQAYWFQAELFGQGSRSETVAPAYPEGGKIYLPTHRRQVYEDHDRGVRFAKYPPGTSFGLTAGTWIGWPHLMVLLAGLLDVWLLGSAARLLGLARTREALLLLVCSPFFALVQTSMQSEVFTLPAALAAYVCVLKMRRSATGRNSWLWAAGIGAACGWIFLCRPLTGVLGAAAFLPGLLLPGMFGSGSEAQRAKITMAIRRVAAAVVAGIPFLVLALYYNYLQTGSWTTAPYQLYAEVFGPFDSQGEPVDQYGKGDFGTGLLRQAGRWSIAFGGVLGFVGIAFYGLWRMRTQDGASGLLLAAFLPFGYALHWYPGHWAYLGPLYCLETLGILILGGVYALQGVPDRWRRGFLTAAVVAGISLFVPRYWMLYEHVERRAAPFDIAKELDHQAVVFLPLGEAGFKLYTPSRPPFDDEVVYLRNLPSASQAQEILQQLGLQERKVYQFHPQRGLQVINF